MDAFVFSYAVLSGPPQSIKKARSFCLGPPRMPDYTSPSLLSIGVPRPEPLSVGVSLLLSVGVPLLLSVGVPLLLSVGIPLLLSVGIPGPLSLSLSIGVPRP
ncbi:hypothetical protein EW145_g3704 [Phellinidium pouzarii]|uniref:Uncharacterized protein n=1 Tax=Phellinidium pouzarii TaxID=167371 RepID=A0A4S4L7M5_9AGAM|nr:hypothetical protein EW145_g3704 [Phellinidium pouzarii]